MSSVSGLLRGVMNRVFLPASRVLFGSLSWTPPRWLTAVAFGITNTLRRFGRGLNSWRVQSPKRFYVTAALLLVLCIGSYAGWRWYEAQPKPHRLSISTTLPQPTKLEPGSKPDPLIFEFSGSAATLEAVNKEVISGVTVTPPIEGIWKWEGDSKLTFNPKDDWKVGENYRVVFDRKIFPKHVRLESYEKKFISPAITATIEKLEFYEDPINPVEKHVIGTLLFSHPVDKADLERKISYKMRIEPVKSFDAKEVKPLAFKLTFDESGAKAFVHSEKIAIPDDEGEVLLEVAKDIHSVRGGKGTAVGESKAVHIPGIATYFRVENVSPTVVTNARHEMERVITIETSAQVKLDEIKKNFSLYLLPKDRPAHGARAKEKDYLWSDPEQFTPEVLALSKRLPVEWIQTEGEFSALQSARFSADAGRYLYVQVEKGVRSFGDYELRKSYAAVFPVEEFERQITILHEGSILSLTGDRKLSVMAVNLDALQVELSRLLPGSVNHLVSQTYNTFQRPYFDNYKFDYDNLSEVLTEVIPVNAEKPGRPAYAVIDFARFMSSGPPPRGLFHLKVRGWDPIEKQPIEVSDADRIVLISDLGAVVKEALDGSRDVFVQSLRTGEAVGGAEVSILGKNGLPLFTNQTGPEGRVHFPTLKDFKREKTPTAYIVQREGDLSFVPYERNDRKLSMSRFETGGTYTSEDINGLQGYLFSDRGIYRPGDEVHIGAIVRNTDFRPLLEGVPLELSLTDPRGLEVRSELLRFGGPGFDEYTFPTQEDSLTGTYQASLYVMEEGRRKGLIGSTAMRVEEFLPDRMTIRAEILPESKLGWLNPERLQVKSTLRTLFGTPAVGRKVSGTLKLYPSLPGFPQFPGYRFFDSYRGKNSYDESLGEIWTNENGEAVFDLKLERFEAATYRMRVAVEGFEAEGGRSVLADVGGVISPAAYLIAYKPDGDLDYIHRDSKRGVSLIAVSPDLKQVSATGLTLELIETRFISALTKQESGVFAYQSVKKEVSLEKRQVEIPEQGLELVLGTSAPGNFSWVIRDEKERELNRISFSVVGDANVARSLERNAELQVKLNKAEYMPGEEINLEIQAPYTGAGLITIERDKVYGFSWFKSETTGSVQRIRVPETLEGNGYVTITFLRGLDSHEIYMNPLSYASAPFAVSKKRRTNEVELSVPEKGRPGETLKIGYKTAQAGKIAIFAVDEGILQVARYKTPDPLSHFFRKRALEVSTVQILDLLLPEFEIVRSLAATGGDEDAFMAGKLNPFKRKGEKPVVYWSGLLSGEAGEVSYPVPEYFSGTLRVMAVAVADIGVGVAEKKTIVKGDFVLQPQVPLFVSPGDEFEVGTLIANNIEGSGKETPVKVSLDAANAFEIVGGQTQEVEIDEGGDKTVTFRLKAKDAPGSQRLRFLAEGKGKKASYGVELSVRPATPFIAKVSSGYFKSGMIRASGGEVPVTRKMSPELRVLEASASVSPLGLATGLVAYLKSYPHGCTEQVVSQAVPAMVLPPQFGMTREESDRFLKRATAILQGRQNSSGSFGFWSADSYSSDFQSIYAAQFLLEARERGYSVPSDTVSRVMAYLETFSEDAEKVSLSELRNRAYAAYVRTRSGIVTTNALASIRESLEKHFADSWREDAAAIYLASTYKLLKLEKEGEKLLKGIDPQEGVRADYSEFYDEDLFRALYLFHVAKHFPNEIELITGEFIGKLADGISHQTFNTISASFAVLGLDAYARIVPSAADAKLVIAEKNGAGERKELTLNDPVYPRVVFSPDTAALLFSSDSSFNLFYQVVESGFDLDPPKEAVANGVEVLREYRNKAGAPVLTVKLDEKVRVQVTIRAPSGFQANIAVSDLLPGGFEPDITPEGLGSRNSLESGDDEWRPDYIDVREDRVVFYGNADERIKRFVYEIKPVARGTFKVAPLVAEGMYDRRVWAETLGGVIRVVD